jgi:glycosyltransferase involved in cell wall biosynthesis
MIALAAYARENSAKETQRALVLQAEAYPVARILARRAGIELLFQPDQETIHREIEQADIVQFYFWNNPTCYEFLRTPLPPMRLLVWSQVIGNTVPQIITRKLVEFADACVVTSRASLELPVFQEGKPATYIYGIADFNRVANTQPRPHDTFNISYIGTLNFAKLHRLFIPMSAAVDIPEVRFIMCGAGHEALLEQARAIGAEAKFEFRGFVENIKPVLEISDVFGYPLCAETSASSEKSLQEALWAGVPPVVFSHPGVDHLVQHEQTGLIVRSELEYQAALERLYYEPELRRRLGEQAQQYAREHFDGRRAAANFDALYDQLMGQPRHLRHWQHPDDNTPSGWFIDSLGDAAGVFLTSKTAALPEEQFSADTTIAAASTVLANGEGGILHYRNTYYEDPYLRYWTALVLIGRGRYPDARRELDAALRYGLIGAYERRFIQETLS